MTAVAIFVKTPGLSPLKTRLVAGWGKERAEKAYLLAADAVVELAVASGIGTVYWAVAETIEDAGRYWPNQALVEQGQGPLGDRMSRVHAQLVKAHGAGLLLGADSPQIDSDWLRDAADWLQQAPARLCIGPASDGGFWTIGANRILPHEHWQAVPYSHPDTLGAFRAAMADQGDWLELPTLTDLDTVEDLPNLTDQLRSLRNPTPRQQTLLTWLDRQHP